MRLILTIEDTPRGVQARTEYEDTGLTDSIEMSLSLALMTELTLRLLRKKRTEGIVIDGDFGKAYGRSTTSGRRRAGVQAGR